MKKIKHKGWNWANINNEAWDEVSSEFLKISFNWSDKFKSMIDIGAGKGRHSFHMRKLGLQVLATDLSESAIKIINEKCKKEELEIDTSVSDMINLPAENNSFDCVMCFHTIYHTDFEGVKRAISEIKRVLKSGGEVFLTFNAKSNPSFKKGKTVNGYTIYKTNGIEKGVPHTYVDFKDIQILMDGFELIKVQKIQNYRYKSKDVGGIHYYVLAKLH